MKYSQQRSQEKMGEQITVEQRQADDSKPEEDEKIQVYVVGAVSKPGVYSVPVEARVYEAIDLAQALPTANLKSINLAQKMEDGQAVVVPAEGEELPQIGAGNAQNSMGIGAANGKVNINLASSQELDEKLPGVGPSIAQRIVDYRESHGRFAKAEDLQEVSGIGDKKYAEIKDLITVR
jgi:competence protein ComEA